MKKLMRYGLLGISILFLSSKAIADPMVLSINDKQGDSDFNGWYNWNNNDTLNPGMSATDENGTPKVDGMNVYYDNQSHIINRVEILLNPANTQRQLFDSLFINTTYTGSGSDWDAWNYYVVDGLSSNTDNTSGTEPLIDGFYEVKNTATYVTPFSNGTRAGNPSGLTGDSLENWVDFGPIVEENKIIYNFDLLGGLNFGDSFFVAYAPWCANDVVGGAAPVAPVPEPATLFLFGSGLVGLAGISRKKKTKKEL